MTPTRAGLLKFWGQGWRSRSGYRSLGQVGGGVKVGVKVRRGQGLGSRLWSRSGSWLWGQGQGHDRWSQGRRSRSVVKVRE